MKKMIIYGLNNWGEKSLKAHAADFEVIGFTHLHVDEETDEFLGLPVIPLSELQENEFDFIAIAEVDEVELYQMFVNDYGISPEQIVVDVLNIFDGEFLSDKSKRFSQKPPFVKKPDRSSKSYFIITSQGRSGSRWLGASLHLHSEIF